MAERYDGADVLLQTGTDATASMHKAWDIAFQGARTAVCDSADLDEALTSLTEAKCMAGGKAWRVRKAAVHTAEKRVAYLTPLVEKARAEYLSRVETLEQTVATSTAAAAGALAALKAYGAVPRKRPAGNGNGDDADDDDDADDEAEERPAKRPSEGEEATASKKARA